jgi:hypothetical protein
MYIFGGFSGRHQCHYNQTYEFDPGEVAESGPDRRYFLDTNKWTLCHVLGAAPTPRRRQCTVRVRDRVFLFGGTWFGWLNWEDKCMYRVFSPSATGGPRQPPSPGGGSNAMQRYLIDLCDLHVLDYGEGFVS